MENTQLRQHVIQFLTCAIDSDDKNCLENDKNRLISALAAAVANVDIENGFNQDSVLENLSNGQYSKQVIENYNEYDFDAYVPILLEKYKNTKTDIECGFSKDKRIEVLKNSINFFQYLLEHMVCDQKIADKYHNLSKNMHKKLKGNYQRTNPILEACELSNMNYILEDEIHSFYYPFVLDILFDTFRLECALKEDPEFTDAIRSLSLSALKQKREQLSLNDDFIMPRIDFLKSINRDQIRAYILSMYHDVLHCKYEDIKSFYKQLLFENLHNHKNEYKDKLDISQIPEKIYFRHFSSLIA